MTESQDYERGPMHGEHSTRFYWGLAIGTTVLGIIGGLLLRPEDWSFIRSAIMGALIGLLSAYCVFAWHWLLGPIKDSES